MAKMHEHEGESPLHALYLQWQALKQEYAARPVLSDGSDAEGERIFNRMIEIEQQAADFDPKTVADLAFKVIFADDNGDMSMNRHQKALARRCYAMVGLVPGAAAA